MSDTASCTEVFRGGGEGRASCEGGEMGGGGGGGGVKGPWIFWLGVKVL